MQQKIKQLEETIEKQEKRIFHLNDRLGEMDRKLIFFEHWLSKMQEQVKEALRIFGNIQENNGSTHK